MPPKSSKSSRGLIFTLAISGSLIVVLGLASEISFFLFLGTAVLCSSFLVDGLSQKDPQ